MRLLVLIILLALGPNWAVAQALIPRPATDGPELPALQCRSQQVTIDIQQQVARVRIEQVFVNNLGQDVEAVYMLPLQESASITRFSYWVKGKEIEGKIQEKQEARAMYDQVVAKRRDPALLEQAGRNLFRVNIFPVSSQEPMRVVLEYSQLCPYENGTVSLRYPLTYLDTAYTIGHFTLQAEVTDQKPIHNLQVQSHGGAIQEVRNDHHRSLRFEARNFKAEKDFQLSYGLKSKDFGVSFLTHRKPGQDGYFMLVVAPQEETTAAQVVHKDVIFVFDRSGSMLGQKMDQAKAALKFCLRRLSPHDRFRLITFSDDVAGGARLQPASPENIARAVQEVEKLEADGGTNIEAALHKAMQGFEPGNNQKIVLFMTDGLPTVGEQEPGKIVANVARANRQAARLFAFGVGDDLDDYLLLKLASDHRGALQYVRQNESIESKIGQFFAKISTPVLVNLQVDFGSIPVTYRYPQTLPDVFKGSQLILVGRYAESGSQKITLRGDINGQSRTFEYPALFAAENQLENAFLERLWAKQRVDWAVDQMRLNGENAELKTEVINLSKTHMFMTPYTSFLAMPKEERERLAASSAGGYPTGADPILSVAAPKDATVVAYFPWGETQNLHYDPKTKLWKCRFIVPASVRHGVCQVAVVITLPDGQQQQQLVCFEADDEPPSGQAVARLHFDARSGWSTEIEVQASLDTRRVLALLPNGKSFNLKKVGPQRFRARLAGRVRGLQLTLLDNGHNRTIMTTRTQVTR